MKRLQLLGLGIITLAALGLAACGAQDVGGTVVNGDEAIAPNNDPAVVDTDGDGVADDQDQCADTAADTKVADNGCPDLPHPPTPIVDDDGDGVPNDTDACPTTKANEPVDEAGCFTGDEPTVVDTDKDGIADDQDKCPGTMAGMDVDEQGCLLFFHFSMTPGYYGNIFALAEYQPKVVAATPVDQSENVGLNSGLYVKMDTPIKAGSMSAHFKLKVFGVIGWFDVPVKLEAAESTRTQYWFKPISPLKPGAMYGMVIEKGLETDKGVSKEDIYLAFTTVK